MKEDVEGFVVKNLQNWDALVQFLGNLYQLQRAVEIDFPELFEGPCSEEALLNPLT